MPIGFGFSVGDFVSGIGLIHDLINALRDSRGSSKEYQQIVAELESLETALVQVQGQYNSIEALAQRDALEIVVQECRKTMEDFLNSIKKYHHHLGVPGASSRMADAFRKIQWRLRESDELSSFRGHISGLIQKIDLLLATIQVTSMAVVRRREDTRDDLTRDQTALLAVTFDAVKQQLFAQGATALHTLRIVDALKQSTLQTLATIESHQRKIPSQVLLQQPLLFTDALNRIAPIHLEWINCWEAFFAVLEIRFRHCGLNKIKRRELTLQERTSGKLIPWSKPLDVSLLPGQHIEMSMVFEEGTAKPENTCPHCHILYLGSVDREVEWCYFQRIHQVTDEGDVEAVKIDSALMFDDSMLLSKKLPSYNVTEAEEAGLRDFKRIRLVRHDPSLGKDVIAAQESTFLSMDETLIDTFSRGEMHSNDQRNKPPADTGSSWPRPETPNRKEWEHVKSIICELYICHDLPISSVIAIMAAEHDFRATARMYKARLHNWGIRKNVTHGDWQAAAFLFHEREMQGKRTSHIRIHGRRRTVRELNQYLKSRQVSMEEFVASVRSTEIDFSAIRCVTPELEKYDSGYDASVSAGNPSASSSKDSAHSVSRAEQSSGVVFGLT